MFTGGFNPYQLKTTVGSRPALRLEERMSRMGYLCLCHDEIEPNPKAMSDTLSAAEEHDLQVRYSSDKHIDSLVQRMADLYKNHAKTVAVGEGAVSSVLPPDIQAKWEALKEELEAYRKAQYPLLPKDE